VGSSQSRLETPYRSQAASHCIKFASMVAREGAGMVLMAVAGFGVAMMVIMEDVLKRLQLPFFTLMGIAILTMAALLAAIAHYQKGWSQLSSNKMKWICVRGFFGCFTYACLLLAVVAGAPLGEASALQSINVIVAALLGRAFLGEPLRWLHMIALCFSVSGAAMITKPQVLLGLAPAPVGGKPWLGYGLALVSGTAAGSTFIAARKSQGSNPVVLTTCVALLDGLMLLLMPATGVVQDTPLRSLLGIPWWMTAATMAGLMVTFAIGSFTLSAGAQLCPAAAASTIFTSVGMTVSFTAQTVLHGEAPEALTVAGAGLLLLGVMCMAVARALPLAMEKPFAESTAGAGAVIVHSSAGNILELSGATSSSGTNDAGTEDADRDDTSSLASFIASEFSGVSASSQGEHGAVRHRRVLAALQPAVQTIGVASA